MTEEIEISVWSLISRWFTPTHLFLVLNLIIGTILLSARNKKNPPPQTPDDSSTHEFFRAPSLIKRVKSINFSLFSSETSEPQPSTNHFSSVPSIVDLVKSFNFSFARFDPNSASEPSSDQNTNRTSQIDDTPAKLVKPSSEKSVNRTSQIDDTPAKLVKPPSEKSVKKSTTGKGTAKKAMPGKAPAKLKKSASEKFERRSEEEVERVERRRPETARSGCEMAAAAARGEDGVNEKADDFINNFRQQLKLQRLNSLLRYTEMIDRGSSR